MAEKQYTSIGRRMKSEQCYYIMSQEELHAYLDSVDQKQEKIAIKKKNMENRIIRKANFLL